MRTAEQGVLFSSRRLAAQSTQHTNDRRTHCRLEQAQAEERRLVQRSGELAAQEADLRQRWGGSGRSWLVKAMPCWQRGRCNCWPQKSPQVLSRPVQTTSPLLMAPQGGAAGGTGAAAGGATGRGGAERGTARPAARLPPAGVSWERAVPQGWVLSTVGALHPSQTTFHLRVWPELVTKKVKH